MAEQNNQLSFSTTTVPTNAATHHIFAIKLNPKNILAWKTQFLHLLSYDGMTGLIDGLFIAIPSTLPSTIDPTQ